MHLKTLRHLDYVILIPLFICEIYLTLVFDTLLLLLGAIGRGLTMPEMK